MAVILEKGKDYTDKITNTYLKVSTNNEFNYIIAYLKPLGILPYINGSQLHAVHA